MSAQRKACQKEGIERNGNDDRPPAQIDLGIPSHK